MGILLLCHGDCSPGGSRHRRLLCIYHGGGGDCHCRPRAERSYADAGDLSSMRQTEPLISQAEFVGIVLTFYKPHCIFGVWLAGWLSSWLAGWLSGQLPWAASQRGASPGFV